MKLKFLLLALTICCVLQSMLGQTNPNFYLHENGVTCMCPNAKVGETGTIRGVVYTKRTKAQITTTNASTTCTSGITDMSSLFYEQSFFNENISSWDVSSVTSMSFMLASTRFNQPIDSWDVSNVTDMSSLFNGTKSFNQPIENWNVSKVTNMQGMFFEAIVFNQPIGNWNVGKVTNMLGMFSGAIVFNQPIGNWNVANVTNMGGVFNTFGMFNNATLFNQPISNWNVSNVINMGYMFAGAIAFDNPFNTWCVTKITTEPSSFSLNAPLTQTNKPIWGTCPTLSDEDFSWLSNEISVYPNPFTNIVKIIIPDNVQVEQVQVNNNLGQAIYTTTESELALEHLQVGLYYLKITTDKGVVTKKLIKN